MKSIFDEAQEIIRIAQLGLFQVRGGECMLCYCARNLQEYGCDGTHRFVTSFRDQAAPRATALLRRLSRMGACCCDCEVFMNAFALADEYVEGGYWYETEDGYEEYVPARAPEVFPRCEGVRRGSTQPCGVWQLRPRGCF